MSLLIIFLIAISLSMDAFSLGLVYGTFDFNKIKILLISLIVGIYHFFMPSLGYIFGEKLATLMSFDGNLLVGIIFIYLSLSIIISIFRNEEYDYLYGIIAINIFALTVSLDSLSIGIGIGINSNINILKFIIFSITSFIFTFIGLSIGKYLSSKFGNYAKALGALILFVLGISYII